MLTREKAPSQGGETSYLTDKKKNIESDKQAEPTEPK